MPLIPALGRQRQADLYEFKASLVYIASSRIAGTKGRPYLKHLDESGMLVHIFSPSTPETEASRSVSRRPVWSK